MRPTKSVRPSQSGWRNSPDEGFSESVEIAVPPEWVWRALTRPNEVVCWDTGIMGPIDAPPDYPKAGQYVRWRYRLGPVRLVLHDRPTLVETATIFASSIRLGLFDFEEIYTLHRLETSSTILTAELSLTSRIPLLGLLIERVGGEPLARATVRTSLAAIKRHCEDPLAS
jgi:hypothetical protein